MRSRQYDPQLVTAQPRPRTVPSVSAELGLVVEELSTGWCGAVVACDKSSVSIEDRRGVVRVFPLQPAGFALDGVTVSMRRPIGSVPVAPTHSASGSVLVPGLRARVAVASRFWVEGRHDAELVERVWGHDLRVEGVVVEALDGVDDLSAAVRRFAPSPVRRLGILVDHLIAGSKESRIVAQVREPDVLITGHPYVDVWQAVKPAAVGIDRWPVVPPGRPWKEDVCAALGWGEPWQGWRRVLAGVSAYGDLEVPLLQAVEALIDFVATPGD